ncbi:hypothetical protein HK105_207092 [Polyrhizophydium stewartii]|uniref:Maf-like protein n=1 Tax=Polyrhizophydium stewartii TaxID=2732419 RepID=A0ABR4N1E1_9FUNG|nr:hypothetical protein HK105_007298 [Polyrhizophydium stewartii]
MAPDIPLPLILGSSSKFRAAILRQHGIGFTVQVPNINEKGIGGAHRDGPLPDPDALTLAVANAKADALLAQLPAGTPPSLLVACDQVTSFQGRVREKPESEDECREYLRSYVQAPAETHSGVVVVNTQTGKRVQGVDVARQHFKAIPEAVIDSLIAKGDVMYSCGGFTIEDPELQPYMLQREGDEDSIIGMPIKLLLRLIAEATSA